MMHHPWNNLKTLIAKILLVSLFMSLTLIAISILSPVSAAAPFSIDPYFLEMSIHMDEVTASMYGAIIAFDAVTTSPTPEGDAHWLTIHNYYILLQRGPPIQRKISRAMGIYIASAPHAPGSPEQVTISYVLGRMGEYDDVLSEGFEIVALAIEAAP